VLTHIHISDFALVDQLDLELERGLSTLTGETGAGKSIMLDALGLALGDRADADKVRPGSKKADIHASFDISERAYIQKWLSENELLEGGECILRRLVTTEGRSRAFINGQTVTLNQLRTLGEMLIDIHSQHEHQSLLNPKSHQRLLDAFGGLKPLAKQVKQSFLQWKSLHTRLHELKNLNEDLNARFQLLHYQVEELDLLALEPEELEQLESKQRALANADTINSHCSRIVSLCGDDDGLKDRLNEAIQLLNTLDGKPSSLCEAEELLANALIHIQEAQSEVDHYLDGQQADSSLLPEIEQRLTTIYDIARKHRIAPEQLSQLHSDLANELHSMRSGDEQIEGLEQDLAKTLDIYTKLAAELSDQRQFASARLSKAVNDKLSQLAMENAKFSMALHASPKDEGQNRTITPAAHGNETAEILISTNPGQAPKPLIKIASGGELSRVSLAIQVVTAQTSTTPTLVFDEVDVGIGGTTGDEVGRLLRELGESTQVLCVTHLAQVASRGHQHLLVSKTTNQTNGHMLSTVKPLNEKDKIAEIARMMGGSVESKKSIAHAREMIKTGSAA